MPQEQFGEEKNCPATICIEIDIEDGDPIFHTVWIWKDYGHKSSQYTIVCVYDIGSKNKSCMID